MEITDPDYTLDAMRRLRDGEDADHVWHTTPHRTLTADDLGIPGDTPAEQAANWERARSQDIDEPGDDEAVSQQAMDAELDPEQAGGPGDTEHQRWLEDHERFLDRLDQLGPAAYNEPSLDEPEWRQDNEPLPDVEPLDDLDGDLKHEREREL